MDSETFSRPESTGTTGPITDTWRVFGADQIPYRILMISKAIDRITAQQVRALAGLSLAEWRVTAYLGRLGETTATGLCTAAQVDRSEVSRAVAALVKRGFVARRPNPAHRLSNLLRLTSDGQKAFERIIACRREFSRFIMSGLDRDAMRHLDECLYGIAEKLDGLGPDFDVLSPPSGPGQTR